MKHTIETKLRLSKIAKLQGRTVSFAGRKHSERTKELIRQKKLGTIASLETKRKLSIANKGKKLTPEHRALLSKIKTGLKHTEATKEKIRQFNLGKKRPLCRGSLHPFWKGGVTPLYKVIRKSPEAVNWRKAVFERDNYTCQICGQIGGRLEADHMKAFSRYPELRFELSNGRTLCKPCHYKTDNYGYKSII